MKQASLVGAVGIILLANALALMHAARNRLGQPEAEIVLTDRELSYYRDSDDSGVALKLRTLNPWWDSEPDDVKLRAWVDKTKLEELGFDCSISPSDPKAGSFYSRQVPRTGFVALEYDGAAWETWMEGLKKMDERFPQKDATLDQERRRNASRLVAIDAARDATALRARHPDRNRVLIVPGVIAISVTPASPATDRLPARSPRLTGHVREITDAIHVPRPFSDGFRALPDTTRDEKRQEPLYRVHLRYGSLLEPSVTGVEFIPH